MSAPRLLYADATAVLRLLFDRPGPRAPIMAAAVVASSSLLEVEVFRTLDSARMRRAIDDYQSARLRVEAAALLATFHLFPIADEVIRSARSPFGVDVRAMPAIHVATAELVERESASRAEFWTHDPAQAAAAISRGLAVHGAELGGRVG